MESARVLAGFSLGQADILRRAMGKKKKEEMDEQREIFVKGCLKNDITEKNAEQIFDLINQFAEYGFNKSHSAAYALISYQTAFLKTYYPTLPSREIDTSFCASTANSIGSSCKTCLQKPLTINETASSWLKPLCLQ